MLLLDASVRQGGATLNENKFLEHMNKRQKRQAALAILFAILFILWLFEPGWRIAKILGLVSSALLFLSMAISYMAEERNKKKSE